MYIRIFPHIHVLKQRQHKRESVKLFLDPFGFSENPKLMPRKSKRKEGTTSYLDHETKERETKINKPNCVLLFKSLGNLGNNFLAQPKKCNPNQLKTNRLLHSIPTR